MNASQATTEVAAAPAKVSAVTRGTNGRIPARAHEPSTSAATDPPPLRPLHYDRSKPSDQVRVSWTVQIPVEYTLADLEKPGVWVHAGQRFKMFDRVEAIHRDFIAEGFVTDLNPPRVTLIACVKVPERSNSTGPFLPPGVEIRRAQPGESEFGDVYLAVRLSDGHIFNRQTPHRTFEEARADLLDNAIFRRAPVIGRGRA